MDTRRSDKVQWELTVMAITMLVTDVGDENLGVGDNFEMLITVSAVFVSKVLYL